MLSIGLMSGTSMDGIDAALLETDGFSELQEKGQSALTYPAELKILLKATEYAVRTHQGDMEAASRGFSQALTDYLRQELNLSDTILQKELKNLLLFCGKDRTAFSLANMIELSTDMHISAIKQLLKESSYCASEIDIIGYHGQTLFHQPAIKRSIIVGFGQQLADAVGIAVINDFRRSDLEKGGQGAPFAPLYHYALAKRDRHIPAAVVNCGGIANVSFIANENILDILAFDTGPGNGLIDRLVRKRSGGREHLDKDGNYGLRGQIHEELFEALYQKAVLKDTRNYFLAPPPKSLDLGDLHLIPELENLSLEDACATLEAFTADSIVHSLQWLKSPTPRQWILAGGGWQNPVIYRELSHRLQKREGKEIKLQHAHELGWNSQALEAQIFAYFAVRSLKNEPLSFPLTTGVASPTCGGRAYLPTKGGTPEVKKWLAQNPALFGAKLPV